MDPMRLPGLERLMEVCRRLRLPVTTTPPGRLPPSAGMLVGGHPLDPMLAVVYSRLGRALFNEDIYVLRVDDSVNELEEESRKWCESWQKRLALPLFPFGGKAALAYYHATVLELADAQGCQPVVEVDTHDLDGPHAVPIASNVDRFFDTYARYLEAEVAADPNYKAGGPGELSFPWGTPELIAQDAPLVEMLRAGRFDPLLKKDEETRVWVAKVVQ